VGGFRRGGGRAGRLARAPDPAALDAWIRVLAAARISEGFTGEYAEFLAGLAAGRRPLDG
jgi:hypothetical protein